jgi:enoyl-CoA hydratase/carnithine racemase
MTGAGDKSFGAGSDISEFPSLIAEGDVVERKLALENATFTLLANMPQPTIAALNSSAYGGGLEIALACDLIIAEAGQVLALPEVKLGVFPCSGGPLRLVARVGAARAREMIFFGDPVTIDQAAQWGIVNRVVDRGRALPTAMEWAQRLAGGSASALAAAKAAVNTAIGGASEEEATREVLDLARQAFAHPDATEGTAAFLEKRSPRFPSSVGYEQHAATRAD